MPSVTVIIVTLNRPDCVRRCLECLESQVPRIDQIMVVDASPDDRTRVVTAEFDRVTYLRNDNGYGRMTASRNIGLTRASGEVIVFVDDDAFVHEGWLAALLAVYAEHSDAGAVGGRVLNNQPNENAIGVNQIGKLTRWGNLEGWFAADPGKTLEVDHIMGCNMSFRRATLAELGGFREDYRGISGVREDSDVCLRVRRLRQKIFLSHNAVVTHIGAPQAIGKRFDARYAYYSARNHMVMLIRNFGPLSGVTVRYLAFSTWSTAKEFAWRVGAAVVRAVAFAGGTFMGIVFGLGLFIAKGREPRRLDPKGERVRAALTERDSTPMDEAASVSYGISARQL